MFSQSSVGERPARLDHRGFLEPVNISAQSAMYPEVFANTLPTEVQVAAFSKGTFYRDTQYFNVIRESPYVAIPPPGPNVTLADATPPGAGDASLVVDGVGPTLTTRILTPGTNIALTQLANEAQISCTIPATSLTRMIHLSTNAYPFSASTSFVDAFSCVFRGTTAYGVSPAMFQAVIGLAGLAGRTVEVRVIDVTNASAVIAGPNSALNAPALLSLTYNANASATPAIWVLQYRRSGAPAGNVSASGLTVTF